LTESLFLERCTKNNETLTKVTTGDMHFTMLQRSYLTVKKPRIPVCRQHLREKRLHHLRVPPRRFAYLRNGGHNEADRCVWCCTPIHNSVGNVPEVTRLPKVDF